jgi:cytoskeletal protein RodZ
MAATGPDNALGFPNVYAAWGTAMADGELLEEEGMPPSAGERLREAREAAGLSLEDIATSTRIPTRHLESLEASDFARLPAPTYSIGFAKNYAAAVGLDRVEIGEQMRSEMGGSRPTFTPAEVFEPADPARAMPNWLIAGAIVAILLTVLLINWFNNRSLEGPDEVAAVNEPATVPQQPAAPAAPQGQGPVVVTAADRAWVEIKDGGVILKQGEMAANEAFQVPATAVAPTLTTAKAEALRITVGTTVVPSIGQAAKKVTVSLKPVDLLRPQPAAAQAVTPPPAAQQTSAASPRQAPARRPVSPPQASRPAVSNPPASDPAANTAAPATPQQ